MTTVDLAVVGSGPAGAAAAITAARAGLRVTLLGPPPPPNRPEESLDPEALAILERHTTLQPDLVTWFPGILGPEGLCRFAPGPDGRCHGAHIDRGRLDDRLRDTAQAHGVQIVSTRIARIDHLAGGSFRVIAGTGHAVQALRLVLATGRARNLGRQLGLRTCRLSPPLLAVAGWQSSTEPAGTAAKFIPHARGWSWLAPLGKGRAVYTHLVRAGTLEAARLARLGPAHNATWMIAAPAAANGWAAAGDTVCALDPSWGRGVLFALATGETAGQLTAACLAQPGRAAVMEAAYSAAIARAARAECVTLRRLTGSVSCRGEEPVWP